MSNLQQVTNALEKLASQEKAVFLSRFFKTGKGEYGEGDVFLGLTVPQQRQVAQKHKELPFDDLKKLLASDIHEYRLVALLIMIDKFKHADSKEKKQIVDFYLSSTKKINNWDLVDLSAPNILGNYFLSQSQDRKILYKLAKSKNLWERRIAIVSTFAFIKKGQLADTLKISERLLGDQHDLIHKAAGWMLREVGKRNQPTLEEFLGKYSQTMPRTMLRYAIEKFPQEKRTFYLNRLHAR